MGDLALDTTTDDLAFSDGDLFFNEGLDAVRQFLAARLRLWQGEWFLDESDGVPYLDVVFAKNPSDRVLAAVFRKAILEVPGVLQLTSFQLVLDTASRELRLAFTAVSEDGPIDFAETISISA